MGEKRQIHRIRFIFLPANEQASDNDRDTMYMDKSGITVGGGSGSSSSSSSSNASKLETTIPNDFLLLARDWMGANAPLFLFFTSVWLLYHWPRALWFFLAGSTVNVCSNLLLKGIIQQPRPDKDQRVLEIAISQGERFSVDKYGMPSGHAQYCGFALAFIYLSLQRPLVSVAYWILTLVTLYQRYAYHNHTLLQIAVGFGLGLGLGALFEHMSQKAAETGWQPRAEEHNPQAPCAFY